MGQCDLHLIHAPNFAPGVSVTIDIRTTIRYAYSYIEAAVIQIEEDTLEVSSYGDYFINGISNPDMSVVGGYLVTHSQPSDKVHAFQIHVGGNDSNETITIKTFKDMVSVKLDHADKARFHGSVGMIGEFGTGRLLARDGVTELGDNPNALAREWQVRDDEAKLFLTTRAPQYPQECLLPSQKGVETGRRLRKKTLGLKDAEKACAHWKEDKEGCVH